MIQSFERLEVLAKGSKVRVAVAGANDLTVLKALKKAVDNSFIKCLLFGDKKKIENACKIVELSNYELAHCETPEETVKKAVLCVRNKEADLLMKGMVNTSIYMKGVLNKEYGLRTDRLISLLAVFELPMYHKLIFGTDSGINVSPSFEQKKEILINSLEALIKMGIEEPKVALLAANEMVNPKIPASIDAANLVELHKSGFFPKCIMEGPLSFDIAFDKKAAEHKGFDSKVSGDLDLILFPNIETGNILSKSWLYFNDAKWAGLVLGASRPVILGSRSDTLEIKYNSILLGCLASRELL